MDPRVVVGRIYKEDYYTMLHTKYKKTLSIVVLEKIFFMFFFPF